MRTYRLTIHILTFFCFLFVMGCGKSSESVMETGLVYIRASNAYSAGQFKETIEILGKEKKFLPALVLRIKAEYFSGDLENAEKTARKVIKKYPSSFESKYYLARILREKNDIKGAVFLTEALLTDNPQDIRVLRLASDLAIENGKTDEALVYLDRAAEFSAESALVLLDRARFKWIAGKGNDALEDLSRAKAMLWRDTPLMRSIINLENIILGFQQ